MGQKQKTERERLNDGNNNGQLSIANATSGGARRTNWAKISTNRYQLLHEIQMNKTSDSIAIVEKTQIPVTKANSPKLVTVNT